MRNNNNKDAEILSLFSEILNKLGEFMNYVRETGVGIASPAFMGRYFAFDPAGINDKDYYRKIVLINCIYRVLNESGINVKSHGYTYLKDAICIVIDMKSMDVCLSKDVYPLIRKKNGSKANYTVEHNIRNSLDSAYRFKARQGTGDENIMRCFERRPSNKVFILKAVQKVQDMMAEEGRND